MWRFSIFIKFSIKKLTTLGIPTFMETSISDWGGPWRNPRKLESNNSSSTKDVWASCFVWFVQTCEGATNGANSMGKMTAYQIYRTPWKPIFRQTQQSNLGGVQSHVLQMIIRRAKTWFFMLIVSSYHIRFQDPNIIYIYIHYIYIHNHHQLTMSLCLKPRYPSKSIASLGFLDMKCGKPAINIINIHLNRFKPNRHP